MGASSSSRAKPSPRSTQSTSKSKALPICGVHVKYLRDLAKDHPDLVDQEIGVIVQSVIKPMTKTLSFADFAQGDPNLKSLVKKKADYFVSYAWKYTLGTVVSALADYEDWFVWMDFLVINQNLGQATLTPNDLKQVFGTALAAIGHALVIVSPWDQPINTQRIWCVFELFMTEQLGVPVELLFAGEDKERFKHTMTAGANSSTFRSVFGNVHVAKAQATVPADREAIMKLVQEFGELRVNNVVMVGLKDWLVKTTLGFGFADDTEEGVNVMNSLAGLYRALGNLEDARLYSDKALKSSKTVFGPDSDRYAVQLSNLAGCQKALGKLNEAESLYHESLAVRKRALGADHPDVAQTLNNLAGLLSAKGDYNHALEMSKEALAINIQSLGLDHPLTLASQAWLADTLKKQGKLDEALPISQDVLARRRRQQGEEHSDTADALGNLAGILHGLGKYNEASSMYHEALKIWKRVLGADHLNVATGLNNLAACYVAQGKLNEAEPLYLETITIFKRVLGPDHPNVATALNSLAAVFYSQGKHNKAEPMMKEALAIQKRALGADHPDLAQSLNMLARLLSSQGKEAEAKKMGREALQIAERALGPDHPVTKKYREQWGR